MCRDYIYANEKLYSAVNLMARSPLTLLERIAEALNELRPALIEKEKYFPPEHYQEVVIIKSMPRESYEQEAEKIAKFI